MRMKVPSWVIFVLLVFAGIGLISQISTNLSMFLIPIVLIAIVFIAYKLGPKSSQPKVKKSSRTEAKVKAMTQQHKHKAKQPTKIVRKRSQAKLHVIDGQKGKSRAQSGE